MKRDDQNHLARLEFYARIHSHHLAHEALGIWREEYLDAGT